MADIKLTCENYHSIFDYISDAVFVYDGETGAIVDVNNKVFEMYGVSPDEARGADIAEFVGQYPYTRETAMERIREAEHDEQLFEWLARDRSGRTFWVEMNIRRATIGGTDRMLAVVRDITRRKRTEQRLGLQYAVARILTEAATVADAMPDVLRSLCEHVGWDLGELWLLDPGPSLLRPGSAWHVPSASLTEFAASTRKLTFASGSGLPGRVLASGRPAWVTDVIDAPGFLRTKAASTAGLHAAFGFPINSGEAALGVIIFFSRTAQPPDEELLTMFQSVGSQIGDFMKRKNAEVNLRRYAQDLERINADLKMFASAASHDLQEPLRVMAGFARLLEQRYGKELDEKANRYISLITDAAGRMQQLVQDLLAYSRISHQGNRFEAVDANAVLGQALTNLKASIEESGASVTVGPLPVVFADRSQLESLLQNLIGNAVKYRGSKTPLVHISAVRTDSGDPGRPGWMFKISDNGIGIERKYFERIFQAFERLHTREEYPGTGMGLAICRKIIERHGGAIRVESEPGKGSSFFFTIPDGPGEPEAE